MAIKTPSVEYGRKPILSVNWADRLQDMPSLLILGQGDVCSIWSDTDVSLSLRNYYHCLRPQPQASVTSEDWLLRCQRLLELLLLRQPLCNRFLAALLKEYGVNAQSYRRVQEAMTALVGRDLIWPAAALCLLAPLWWREPWRVELGTDFLQQVFGAFSIPPLLQQVGPHCQEMLKVFMAAGFGRGLGSKQMCRLLGSENCRGFKETHLQKTAESLRPGLVLDKRVGLRRDLATLELMDIGLPFERAYWLAQHASLRAALVPEKVQPWPDAPLYVLMARWLANRPGWPYGRVWEFVNYITHLRATRSSEMLCQRLSLNLVSLEIDFVISTNAVFPVLERQDWTHQSDAETWRLSPLDTAAKLKAEGKIMQHCVFRYWKDAALGKTFFFSLQRNGVRLATIEVDLLRDRLEVLGSRNVHPSPEVLAIVARWVTAMGWFSEGQPSKRVPHFN